MAKKVQQWLQLTSSSFLNDSFIIVCSFLEARQRGGGREDKERGRQPGDVGGAAGEAGDWQIRMKLKTKQRKRKKRKEKTKKKNEEEEEEEEEEERNKH